MQKAAAGHVAEGAGSAPRAGSPAPPQAWEHLHLPLLLLGKLVARRMELVAQNSSWHAWRRKEQHSPAWVLVVVFEGPSMGRP